jgi:AraC family transcriptional regulator, dual regulator of chb operon
MTAPRVLTWAEEETAGGCLHIARHRLATGVGFIDHTHDFAELMWIESGAMEHQRNGRTEQLTSGDLLCIRPSDVHCARAVGSHGCTLVNLSFEPQAVRELAIRCGTRWPWRDHQEPTVRQLTLAERERLHGWAQELSAPGQRLIDLDCFLLDITRLLADDGPADHTSGLPGWLREALIAFTEPRHLRGGVPALARLADRGQAHLNRTVRQCQGRRATDLVNAVRLAWAAAQLRMSDQDVASIAEACGLSHVGHFYTLFEDTFGTTPARYRRAARGEMPNIHQLLPPKQRQKRLLSDLNRPTGGSFLTPS